MKTKLTKIKLFFLSISVIVISFVAVSEIYHEDHHNDIASHRSSEENDRLIREFKSISSDAEFAEWISEYYEIPFTETDFTQLREYARSVQMKTIEVSVLDELEEACFEALSAMQAAEATGEYIRGNR